MKLLFLRLINSFNFHLFSKHQKNKKSKGKLNIISKIGQSKSLSIEIYYHKNQKSKYN